MKKRFSEFLRIGISLFFIFVAAYFLRDKWHHSIAILKQANWYIFSIACILLGLVNIIVAYRFYRILQVQTIQLPFHRVLYLSFVGLFFNLFLPSALGGDVVKAYYISKESGLKLKSVASIVADRLLGLGATVLVALLALPWFIQQYSDSKVGTFVLLIAAGFGGFILLFLNESLAKKFKFLTQLIPTQVGKRKISEFYYMLANYRHHPIIMGYCLILSLAVQGFVILVGFLTAQSLGVHIPFMIFLIVLPMASIAAMFPSVGGLGVREASLIYFLSRYSSVSEATAFALAYDILIYGFGSFCGILYLLFHGTISIKEVEIND